MPLNVDDDMSDGEVNPCRVNATVFARRASCNLRCVVRRNADQCFMCNRTCNGKYDIFLANWPSLYKSGIVN